LGNFDRCIVLGKPRALTLLLGLTLLSGSARAGILDLPKTVWNWGCGVVVSGYRSFKQGYTASHYEASDFPLLNLHRPYRSHGLRYQQAQADLANMVVRSVRTRIGMDAIFRSAAQPMQLAARRSHQEALMADRYFGEIRTFEMETGCWPAPPQLKLAAISPREREVLRHRFEKEFMHVMTRTRNYPEHSPQEWAEGIIDRRILYYHSLSGAILPLAVQYRSDLASFEDFLHVLHPSIPEARVIMADVEERLVRFSLSEVNTVEDRRSFWTAYFGALLASPFAEGNHEISAPLFAGFFLASKGEKLKSLLPRTTLWENALISQSHFVDFMERAYQLSLLTQSQSPQTASNSAVSPR